MITFLKITYGTACFFYNSYTFMPNDSAFNYSWYVSFHNVKVGSANRCLQYSNQCICGLKDNRLWLLFPGFFSGTVINQCIHSSHNGGKALPCGFDGLCGCS